MESVEPDFGAPAGAGILGGKGNRSVVKLPIGGGTEEASVDIGLRGELKEGGDFTIPDYA